jgi:hypothetical protein
MVAALVVQGKIPILQFVILAVVISVAHPINLVVMKCVSQERVAVVVTASLVKLAVLGSAAPLRRPVVMIPAACLVKLVVVIQSAALQMRAAVVMSAALRMKLAAITPLAV